MLLIAPNFKTSFGRRLLRWYRRHKRPLPWRSTRDPYKIWVSEVMLQQTQVAIVIPYYERWIKTFPDIRSLAKAPASKVLKLWEGLGYYRRARMLHRAARQIMNELGGRMPDTTAALRCLPGLGRYSAGAIASIAFEEKTPIVDGNVVRVITRLFAIRQSVDRPQTIKNLWEIAEALLPERAIGNFNQALMELGAMVCTPQNPGCGKCPVRKFCKAHRIGKEMAYPVKTRPSRYEELKMFALVLANKKGCVFIQKQPGGRWWTGLWTFPFSTTSAELVSMAKGKEGLKSLGTIRHGVTRFRIELRVFLKWVAGFPELRAGGRWVSVKHLSKMALPSPHRKIAGLFSRYISS